MPIFDQLPQDVLDGILLSLPDFTTLSAVLRTSKSHLYNTFQAHPKSTALSIAYNLVGPALPQAVRVVFNADPKLCDEDTILADRVLDRDACELLQQNAAIVQRLEDLFSFRNKDRSSAASKLTSEESLRFHRAAYRFWLYCKRVQAELEENDTGYEQILDSWPTDGLLEIDRVASFLQDVLSWTFVLGTEWSDGWDSSPPAVLFMGGPDTALSYWESAELPETLWVWHLTFNFDEQLRTTLARRNIKADAQVTERAKAIIDTAYGSQDDCYRCHEPKGLDLWGRPNWQLLRGIISVRRLIQTLEGNLSRNSHEMSQLADHIQARDDDLRLTFDWAKFIEELCDMDGDAEGPWDKDQWYCLDCLLALVRLRLREWWTATKVKEGMQFKPDCWYGYNCRTQVHRAQHATKLNHLCTPTRGDPA
ncbi:uncharacterized protein PHACADRAFT_133680 [Phanerochaete carnosa HHB-10118-sp]|uniref:Uncharacterized protein n=1 Tax=Phanerochaete carnosa (strain HHB-10118-sp) TaxID=650164 RepID=K5WN43_PHACS|nr:uncharacterized protein PHACADRAFT_133680 [Phanerochaete carnosa HHB-10118-sp]EKM60840.1 hypothetical protein PHACADRAFT_133680 [Phanerochaete carnosa HHB-10118-sp]